MDTYYYLGSGNVKDLSEERWQAESAPVGSEPGKVSCMGQAQGPQGSQQREGPPRQPRIAWVIASRLQAQSLAQPALARIDRLAVVQAAALYIPFANNQSCLYHHF